MPLKELYDCDPAGFCDLIVSIITLIVVTIGLLSIKFQKKEIHFSTVQKCIDDHRNILRNQQRYRIENRGKDEHLILIRDHLGLITEELFYMREGYLPKDLSMSWIKHMIEFVPIKYEEETLNKLQIRESREISCFLKSTDKQASKATGKIEKLREKNLNEYIALASDRKSFSQINNVFGLTKKQVEQLTSANNNICYNDKNTKKLLRFIWKNNRKQF